LTRIAVLGSSAASAYLATILAEDPRVTEIVRGPSSDPAPAVFRSDVIVGPRAADPDTERAAAAAAIAAKVPYVSTSESPDVTTALMGLHGRAVDAGALVVSGLNWSPGLSNLMAKMAARELDPPISIRISWAISSAGQTAQAALTRGAGALSGEARVIRDGSLRTEAAGTDRRRIFLPEPVGWVPVRLARSAEPLTLARSLAGLKDLAVYGGLVEPVANLVVGTPVAGLLARKVNEKLMSFASQLRPPHPWSALRVDASGGRGGITTTVTLGIVDQLSNLLTAPVVVGALMVAEMAERKVGVLAPEDVFDPENFFARLAYHGVRLARLERSGL
jgi:hypothetical protein